MCSMTKELKELSLKFQFFFSFLKSITLFLGGGGGGGKDILAVLPTGFKESIIFQLFNCFGM